MIATAADQLYEIREKVTTEGRLVLSAELSGVPWSSIALAGMRGDVDHPNRWMVMLGFDAAKAIGDRSHADFDVRDEAEARQWLDLLARLYFANPPRPDEL